MNLKAISTLGVASLALIFSACTATVTTNTNSTKPANAPANTTATNTTATNTTAANSTASNTTASNSTATAPAADGSVIKIESAGIQFTVPKGFKISKDGEDTTVTTEDGGVETRFTVPESGDYETAVKDAAKELDEYLDNVKMTDKPKTGTVDGMELTSMEGTGKDSDGKEVNFSLQILKGPKKPVLLNTYAEKASLEKHAADLDAFFKSVKKQQ